VEPRLLALRALEPLLVPLKALRSEPPEEPLKEGLGLAAGEPAPVVGLAPGDTAPVEGRAPGETVPVEGRLPTAPVLGEGDRPPVAPPDPHPRASWVAGLAAPAFFKRAWSGCHRWAG
jgi:hypothetical protein